MQSTADGSHDHRQMGSQKGNSDLSSTNPSQCARRITLAVCTTEVSVRSLKTCLKYHLRGKREGSKKKGDNISQGNTVLRIKELPQAKQNHDKSLNPGHTHFLKTVGCYDIERVQRRGIPKAETNSPGSFGTEKRQLKEKKADIESVIEDKEKVPRA